MEALLRGTFRVVGFVEELILAGGILGIAALTIANVVGRTLLGESLVFAEEATQFLMILVTFVGLGYGAARGRHIRMTALVDQLPKRGRKVLATAVSGTTSALLFFLTFLSLRYVVGTVMPLGARSPVLGVPFFLVYLAAPFGLSLAALHYGLTCLRNLRSADVYVTFDRREDELTPDDASGAH